MGLERKVLSSGNGVDFPTSQDKVTVHYTLGLYDSSKADNNFMGDVIMTSYGRPQTIPLEPGSNIRGFLEGVPQMSLGEHAILTFTPDMGLGEQGKYLRNGPLVTMNIPAHTNYVLDIELLAINDKKA
ncbi:peptidyl-prolyl cis-trans isomerase [Aspergillus transmontanensis]|uniref:peptidylprolyl isomerase n=1 Tax=Aspergillus transmontanensis TaxID=1034304 RepID=A0A5N6VW68_9EURO|nr:peptidyl-prolyl cis-trans isomerase [Aspergillus transmontanensis]